MIDPRAMAERLIDAEYTRTPITPFSQAYPFLDADTAYKAQWYVVEHRLTGGEELAGAKLGLTSRVKRDALGIDAPVYGRLTTGMLVPHGEPVRLGELIHPRAEPELAFLVGEVMEPPATIASVLAATAAVLAAIEVVDRRRGGGDGSSRGRDGVVGEHARAPRRVPEAGLCRAVRWPHHLCRARAGVGGLRRVRRPRFGARVHLKGAMPDGRRDRPTGGGPYPRR